MREQFRRLLACICGEEGAVRKACLRQLLAEKQLNIKGVAIHASGVAPVCVIVQSTC